MSSLSRAIRVLFSAALGSALAAALPSYRIAPVVLASDPVAALDSFGDPLPDGSIARLGTLRLRHVGGVESVAFSADGKRLASGGEDGVLAIWDVASGRLEKRFQNAHCVTAVAFSADGRWLASCTGEAVTLRDAKTGREETLFQEQGKNSHVDWVWATFSPDSKYLATTDNAAGNVCLWDISSRKLVHRWKLGGLIRAMAFSPDGTLFASAPAGGKGPANAKAPILVWNVLTGKEMFRLEGHINGVGCLRFSPNGKLLASTGSVRDLCLRLWDVETKKEVWKHENVAAGGLAFSPDGKTLIEASSDMRIVNQHIQQGPRQLRIRSVADGKILLQVAVHRGSITSTSCSPDGSTIATAGRDNTIKLWDRATGKEITPCAVPEYGVMALAFSSDGKRLASRHENVVRIWDVPSRKELFRLPMGNGTEGSFDGGQGGYRTRSVCFSPNGRFVAAIGPANGICYVWDALTGKEVALLRSECISFNSVVIPTNDSLLATGDGIIHWSLPDGKLLRKIPPTEGAYSADLSPDGQIIAAALGSHPTLYRGDSRTELMVEGRKDGRVVTVVFSPDGKMLAGAGGTKQPVIDVWDIATGKRICTLQGHQGSVYNVAFSADGRKLVSAGHEDRTVRLWDVFTGKALGKWEGHTGAVYAAAFSPDGKTAASGSADGTILLWDRHALEPPTPAKALSTEELAERWSQVEKESPSQAYPAMAVLADAKDQTVDFLRARLRRATSPESKRILELIRRLDASKFEEREQAQQELAQFGAATEKYLREALDQQPNAEVKRRLEVLLRDVQGLRLSGPERSASRAIQILEMIGSPKAVEVLEALTKGDANANLTKDAKMARDRIQRHLAER